MKRESTEEKVKKYFDQRMDSLENLVKLLMMSNLISECKTIYKNEIFDDVRMKLNGMGFVVSEVELFGENILMKISSEYKISIKDIRNVKREIEDMVENTIVVFELDKITSTQRRKFIEEKISFSIKNKELYVIS